MDTSGTNFHRSNLLGTLAYFGSPAVALRTQANANSLEATSLYSRAVVPLSDTGLGTSAMQTTELGAAAAPVETNVGAENTAAPAAFTTAAHTHITVSTLTDTPPAPPQNTVVHTTTIPTHQATFTQTIDVSGDPHFMYNGTEWTQQGTPGDTYLMASGNGVALSVLYGQNGGYDYCTMQDAQLVIAANPAANLNSEVVINYAIYDPNTIQVTTIDGNGNATTHDYSAANFGTHGTATFGSGPEAVSVQFHGSTVTVTSNSPSTHQHGVLTIDSSWGLGLEITAHGTFDNANGLLQYLQSGNNIDKSQSALDAYADANFNVSALGGANSAYNINPNGMPGFSSWAKGHSNWNSSFKK